MLESATLPSFMTSPESMTTKLWNQAADDLDTPPVETKEPPLTLAQYIREAWHVIEPGTLYVHGWHIDALADHLEALTRGEIRNLLITMPPRHAKSICVAVMWPTWTWTIAPEKRFLFAAYAQGLSTRDSVKCRRIIESPWYRRRWGHMFTLTSDMNLKMRFENSRMGYRLATSVGGSNTGEGGDFLGVDDAHNIKEVSSKLKRTAVIDWWDQVMSTRGNDPKTVGKVVVAQRCHHQDLPGHILSQGGWTHLNLPAEYEGASTPTSIGWVDPRKDDGELLWPERFGPVEVAQLKKDLGSYAAAGQLQQRPSPLEGGMVKRHWWQWYHEAPVCEEYIQSWDCSFKDTKTSSYVVGQVWGRKGADFYLLDQDREHLDFTATLRAIRSLSQKWPQATAKYIEDKANGTAIINTLCHKIVGIIPVNPTDSKEARFASVTPVIESGNVYLKQGAPWSDDLVEEAAAFPDAPFDDICDATSQALNELIHATGVGLTI